MDNEKERAVKHGSFTRDTWIFLGLVTLSILYLFEVDYSKLTWLNGAAFVIIAATLIPLLVSIIRHITRFAKANKQKSEEKLAAKKAKEALKQQKENAAQQAAQPHNLN